MLACLTLMTLDHVGASRHRSTRCGGWSARSTGPSQAGVDTALRPFVDGAAWVRTQDGLIDEVDTLEAENARLRGEVATIDYDRNRLQEYDGLTRAAEQIGYALVPARVVGYGAAQSFSQTVTIDAGTRAGVRADQTVVNADGLVGRVIRVTSTTATVLLVIDADSHGRRPGRAQHGGRVPAAAAATWTPTVRAARLDLELVDQSIVPARGDAVVTWGSDRGAPYVSGRAGRPVTSVYSSLRDTTQRAEIDPYVDFGALDLVGVVVPSGTESDRAVVEADGSWQ